MMTMLDAESISELKILENPKLSTFVKKALEESDFLDALLDNTENEDWLLRWGISTVLVQVSKRKPELLKDKIHLFISRLLYEDKRMVRDHISQSLVHLSYHIPEDFIRHDAPPAFVQYLKNGEDHERFDAVKVMANIASTDGNFVRDHLRQIEDATREIDNPVVKAHTERALQTIKNALA